MGDNDFKQLIYTKSGKVVEITLNRPDVLNALSVELYTELGFELEFFNAPRRISCTGDRTAATEVLAKRGL